MSENTCGQSRTDWVSLGRGVLDIEMEGLAAVRDRLGPSFETALSLLAGCRGRVVVTGLGKSGLVGRKLAATFSSTGTPAFFLHPVEGAHGDMGSLRAEDVVIALSNSGETDELNAILPSLRAIGAAIIALTGKARSTLGRAADVVLDAGIPREACPHNLAPTASTTAALALGDALAVCLIHWKSFTETDFLRYHPGGSLGQRLRLRVQELMHTASIPVVRDDAGQEESVRVLDKGGFGAVAVVDHSGRLTGILTDGDVRRAVIRSDYAPCSPVAAIMTRDPRSARSGQSVAELLDIMERKAITVLPIVDDAHCLLGLVHLHDLLGKGGVRFAG